jgi:hypothetical protein
LFEALWAGFVANTCGAEWAFFDHYLQKKAAFPQSGRRANRYYACMIVIAILRRLALAGFAALALSVGTLSAEGIASGHYRTPTLRYGHFALGPPHEYAELVALSRSGARASYALPEDEVFEDIAPRVMSVSAASPAQLLTIVSSRSAGARLVLFALREGTLVRASQSKPIGTPNRWLNPVAVVDLDGDGNAEITAVITPHIGGTLKVFRLAGTELIEIAALGGFSNHAYGSPITALSGVATIAGRAHLIVPDFARQNLRVIAYENGQLRERGRCAVEGGIVGPVQFDGGQNATVRTARGTAQLDLAGCLR